MFTFPFSAIFPGMTLLLAIAGGVWMVALWRIGGRSPALLFWGAGLLVGFWYKIPNILAQLKVDFVLSSYNGFFVLAAVLAISFYVCVLLGVRALHREDYRSLVPYGIAWVLLHGIFNMMHFFDVAGLKESLPLWISTLCFYLPTQIAVLFVIRSWVYSARFQPTMRLGTTLLSTGMVLFIMSSCMYVFQFFAYPPVFWYVVATSGTTVAVLQVFGVVFSVFGMALFGSTRKA